LLFAKLAPEVQEDAQSVFHASQKNRRKWFYSSWRWQLPLPRSLVSQSIVNASLRAVADLPFNPSPFFL
jgi:hypothetical protein